MLHQSVTLLHPASGFRARLTVGDLYRKFEVVEISKVDLAAGKEILGKADKDQLGTYNITFQGSDGARFKVSNNQAPGLSFCLHLTTGKLGLVPAGLEQLAWDAMTAEFHYPVAPATT